MNVENYVTTRLEQDLKTLLEGREGAEFDRRRPPARFVERLPASAATALSEFDRLVRFGVMPSLEYLSLDNEWDYGFDFAANDCDVFDAEERDARQDVFALGEDGGGNKYVLHVNGRVYVWNHEESVLESHTGFSSLDAFLFTVVRLEALLDGTLTVEAEDELRVLDEPGAKFLLERLDE